MIDGKHRSRATYVRQEPQMSTPEGHRSEPLHESRVGDTLVTLYSELLPVAEKVLEYDFLFSEAFIVEVGEAGIPARHNTRAVYPELEMAKQRYDAEVAYAAVKVARKAMRIGRAQPAGPADIFTEIFGTAFSNKP